MGINKKFFALFAILLLVISVLPNIYNKSDKLSQEIALSEAKTKEQETKILDTTEITKENNFKTELKVTNNTNNEVTLNWECIDKVDGYIISRSPSKEGSYEEVYTSQSKDESTYTDIELEDNGEYYYKINTYIENNKEKIYGPDSEICTVYTTRSNPMLYVKEYDEKGIKIAWDNSDKVDGYEIYRASNNGQFYILLEVDKNYYSKFIDRDVDRGNTYSYKIRSYKLINGEKVYGDFSQVESLIFLNN